MAVYLRIYATAAEDGVATTAAGATYATVRNDTAALNFSVTNGLIGQVFSGGTYTCSQYLAVFDTSSIPSGTTGILSLFIGGASTSGDTVEVRAISGATTTVAGDSLAALTPLYASWAMTSTFARTAIPITDLSVVPRQSSCQMLFSSLKQRTAVAPTTATERVSFNTADDTGTTNDPYLQTSGSWTLVGISNVVEVTTASHALVTTGISGLAQGDLMIACISSRIASATAMTLPTGGEWALCNQRNANNTATNNSATSSATMAYCIRGASNPNLTFTHPAAPSVAIGRIIAYRCSSPIGPNAAASVNSVTPTATLDCTWTGVTSINADDLLVIMLSGGQEATFDFVFAGTTPVGGTDIIDTTTPPTLDTVITRFESITTTGADTSLCVYDAIPRGTSTGSIFGTATVSAAHTMIAQAFSILQSVDDAWNILDKSSNITLSSSDKVATWMTTADAGVRTTQTRTNGTAGKFYAEMLMPTSRPTHYGITPVSNALTALTSNFYYQASDGNVIVNGSTVGNIGTQAANDILCIAWDAGAEKVWFRRNAGNWNNSGTDNPATGAGGFDCTFAASTAHALWARNTGTAGSNVTLRTELADYTQGVPDGFTSWMGETPPVPRRPSIIRPTEAVARSFRW